MREHLGTHDPVELSLCGLELVVEARELAVFDVEQLLVVVHRHCKVLTPRPHLNLTVLDQGSAALCQTLIEILA